MSTLQEAINIDRQRKENGLKYFQRKLPGTAHLWTAYQENDANRIPKDNSISLSLGLSLLALPVHEWHGIGIPPDQCYGLISHALEILEPPLSFEEQLANIDKAYAVIGQRGTGKTTLLHIFSQEGIYTAPSSTVLREVVRSQQFHEPLTPQLVDKGQQLKNEFGPDILLRWTLMNAFESPEAEWKQIAIDGLRTPEELTAFINLFGERARIIAVLCNAESLWKRVQERQQRTGIMEYPSKEEFMQTQAIEEPRITALLPYAHFVLDNSGNDQESRRRFEEEAKKIALL